MSNDCTCFFVHGLNMESATSQFSTASCELTPYSPAWNNELVSVHFDLAHVPSEPNVKYNLNELCEVSDEAGCSKSVEYDWINKLENPEGGNVSRKNQIVNSLGPIADISIMRLSAS